MRDERACSRGVKPFFDDGLLDLARRDHGSGALNAQRMDEAIARRLGDTAAPFALLVGYLQGGTPESDVAAHEQDRIMRDILRLLVEREGSEIEVGRFGPGRLVVLAPVLSAAGAQEAAAAAERAIAAAGRSASFGWSFFPADGRDALCLIHTACERLYARRAVRGEWKPTAASAGLVEVIAPATEVRPFRSTSALLGSDVAQ